LFVLCRLNQSEILSGAVYELNKSYDQVFIVIGGVYAVDTLVFGAAALLQSLRRQRRRRLSAAVTAPDVDCRCDARFPLSSDVRRADVDATPAVITVSPLISTYGTVVVTSGTAATEQPVIEDGVADSGKRRNQTGTTTAPFGVRAQ